MADDEFHRAAQSDAFKPGATVSGNNDQINAEVICSVDDGVSGMTGFDEGCDREAIWN